jgi:hypothetical protein
MMNPRAALGIALMLTGAVTGATPTASHLLPPNSPRFLRCNKFYKRHAHGIKAFAARVIGQVDNGHLLHRAMVYSVPVAESV